MYSNNKVRLIIRKTDTSIPFEVGVKQGDSVAPGLFLCLMMAFAEVIEQEWDKQGIRKIEFKWHTNSPHSTGRATSHPAKNFLHCTLFNIFYILYVDNNAFAFISRYDLGIGTRLVFKTFAKFGLQMHISSAEKVSKTKCVFFSTPGHWKPPTLPPSTTDPHLMPFTLQPTQESAEKKENTMTPCMMTYQK